jgi:hypothetical protein
MSAIHAKVSKLTVAFNIEALLVIRIAKTGTGWWQMMKLSHIDAPIIPAFRDLVRKPAAIYWALSKCYHCYHCKSNFRGTKYGAKITIE